MPQTLTLRKAEPHLYDVIMEAQSKFQAVILTSEETAAPIALLTPLSDEANGSTSSLAHRLETLESIILLWQQNLESTDDWQDYALLLQSQLRLLAQWQPAHVPNWGALLMLLRLAVRQIRGSTTEQQLAALEFGITMLKAANITPDALAKTDQMLRKSGLEIQADIGDQQLLELYVNAS